MFITPLLLICDNYQGTDYCNTMLVGIISVATETQQSQAHELLGLCASL